MREEIWILSCICGKQRPSFRVHYEIFKLFIVYTRKSFFSLTTPNNRVLRNSNENFVPFNLHVWEIHSNQTHHGCMPSSEPEKHWMDFRLADQLTGNHFHENIISWQQETSLRGPSLAAARGRETEDPETGEQAIHGEMDRQP